jgi:hypothetical protein
MTKEEFYEVKGKMIVGKATPKEVSDFLHVVEQVFEMVEEASCEDFYGTEGYQHQLGWDE